MFQEIKAQARYFYFQVKKIIRNLRKSYQNTVYFLHGSSTAISFKRQKSKTLNIM